ncbi:MAG: hypothetical protein KAQ71_22285 [Desulfobulbaceae bacterium]|nr:hypothetical protein [Desulfobulbaceae bacterium]
MKALIVSADMFEDSELLIPYYRLLEEKIETDIHLSRREPSSASTAIRLLPHFL